MQLITYLVVQRDSLCWSIHVKVLYSVLLCLFVAVCLNAQSRAPLALATTIEDVHLAKDDGIGGPGEQVTEFRTTDVPIYCVILLDSQEKTLVKMNFVAVKVTGVKPETNVVTASYTTKNGQNRVNFTGRPDGKWTPGKYRVDLFLDGKIVRNVEFEIKATGVSAVTRQPKYLTPPESPKPNPARRPVKH